jgi:SAM-dependent methyltransferase
MKYLISLIIRKVPRKYLQLFSHSALKVLSIFYAGKNVTCSVCEKSFRKFLPYGRFNPRENALCPNCLALERHRLMWLFLKKKTNFFQAELKVLHVAPEICFIHRFEKLPNLDYITGDIESPLAKVKFDLHEVPFADNSFNVAFCNHVMEHVTDDIHCMGELLRVLKPGGWAIIQSPIMKKGETYEDPSITDPKEREKAFGQDDHVRMYGDDYPERLRKAGFKVTDIFLQQELDPALVDKYALPKDEIIYYCQKAD